MYLPLYGVLFRDLAIIHVHYIVPAVQEDAHNTNSIEMDFDVLSQLDVGPW